MFRVAIAAAILSFSALPANASDCGSAPTTPAQFDPASAQKADILRLKSDFEAFKTANTQYISCLKQGVLSAREKRLINTTVDAEADFAKAFNTNAKAWAKAQSRQSR